MKLIGIVGSAVKSVRTRKAIETACEGARQFLTDGLDIDIINLSKDKISILDGRKLSDYTDDTERVVTLIETGDVFLIGSPAYRGTYTGALKNLLDHAPISTFENKPVGFIATGATAHHYLMIDHEMRAVLAWSNAYLLPGSVYVENRHYEDGKIIDSQVHERLLQLGKSAIQMAQKLDGLEAEPLCLTRQLWK